MPNIRPENSPIWTRFEGSEQGESVRKQSIWTRFEGSEQGESVRKQSIWTRFEGSEQVSSLNASPRSERKC